MDCLPIPIARRPVQGFSVSGDLGQDAGMGLQAEASIAGHQLVSIRCGFSLAASLGEHDKGVGRSAPASQSLSSGRPRNSVT